VSEADARLGSDAAASSASIIRALVQSPGYSLDFRLSPDELAKLRMSVSDQFHQRLAEALPDRGEDLRDIQIEDYHRIAATIDHERVWPKAARILPQAAVTELRGFGVFQSLERLFGPYDISNEEDVSAEEVYWRIVRPNAPKDIGPLHADAWFWELGHGSTPPGKARIKLWIAIHAETGKSGLALYPDSHQRDDLEFEGVLRDGFVKPQIRTDVTSLPRFEFTGQSGGCVLFNDRLLHGGVLNVGERTRVSAECTLFVDAGRLT
jgi:hypothetical protein